MSVLTIDVETTIKNKGNPFTRGNKLVCVGVKTKSVSQIWYDNFEDIQEWINNSSLIIGFNIKFDLHWIRNAGIDISNITIWDCQLAEFILENQKNPYPSLNQTAEKYGLGQKIDVIKEQYWEKGIDTDAIPQELLSSYLEQDLDLTYQIYLKQLEQFKNDKRYKLFKLQCADLLVLEEMEYNGIKFNTGRALAHAKEIGKELDEINRAIMETVGNVPFNSSSNDHVSAALYGGKIVEEVRIPIGVYKTGAKVGQTRFKVVEKVWELPRMVEPIKGTETKKARESGGEIQQWEVNETVLRKLKLNKRAKEFVSLLRRSAELEKLRGTYLEGYTKLINTMDWPSDTLHGTLNQCVVITGRLSSTKPNLQNADPTTKIYMTSRYD